MTVALNHLGIPQNFSVALRVESVEGEIKTEQKHNIRCAQGGRRQICAGKWENVSREIVLLGPELLACKIIEKER